MENTTQKCKDCKHFEPLTDEDNFGHFLDHKHYLNYGSCNGIERNSKSRVTDEDIMLDEAWGELAGLYFHKEFGCIKFVQKEP